MQFVCPHCGGHITGTVQGHRIMPTKAQQRILMRLKTSKAKWLSTLAIAAKVGRSKSTVRQVLDRLHAAGKVVVRAAADGKQLEWSLS